MLNAPGPEDYQNICGCGDPDCRLNRAGRLAQRILEGTGLSAGEYEEFVHTFLALNNTAQKLAAELKFTRFLLEGANVDRQSMEQELAEKEVQALEEEIDAEPEPPHQEEEPTLKKRGRNPFRS
jgi:hypothetical protein